MLASLVLAAAVAAAHPAPPAIEPVQVEALPAEQIAVGCGCTYYSTPRPVAGKEILRWNRAEGGGATMKLDGEVRRLRVVQEKHLPRARETPRYADRLVLILGDDHYMVEVASSVKRACRPQSASCAGTGYAAAFILRRDGAARRELRGWGECGC
ncbi:MAG: hypothetical protein H6R11_1835 [Proteobacteria bacterium]|nr:hypothetical protein [Pseudomonadota bacterium]